MENKRYITWRKQLWVTDASSFMIVSITTYRDPLGPKLKPFRHSKDLECSVNSAETGRQQLQQTQCRLLLARAGGAYQNSLSTVTVNSSHNWNLVAEASS